MKIAGEVKHRPSDKASDHLGNVMREEKRQHPRAAIKWPTVLITTAGHIFGQTVDLSLGGALFCSWEQPEVVDSCDLIFKPPRQRSYMTVTAKEVRVTTCRLDHKTIVHGLGVRFTEIFDADRQFLSKVISNHLYAA